MAPQTINASRNERCGGGGWELAIRGIGHYITHSWAEEPRGIHLVCLTISYFPIVGTYIHRRI